MNLSCEKKDECSHIFNVPPPKEFYFFILDKTTGEDLLANGTYDPSKITFDDKKNTRMHFFYWDQVSYSDQAGLNHEDSSIVLFVRNSITGPRNIELNIAKENIINLSFNAKKIVEPCRFYTQFNDMTIESEFESEITHNGTATFVILRKK